MEWWGEGRTREERVGIKGGGGRDCAFLKQEQQRVAVGPGNVHCMYIHQVLLMLLL